MGKRHRGGEHENLERWLLTYADLITLLLGLFVILYAMSKIDAGKYAEMVAALGGVFGHDHPSVLQGNQGVVQSVLPPIVLERQKIEQEVAKALSASIKSGLVSVTEGNRGVTVHLMEELLFNSGSAELKPSSLRVLDSLAAIILSLHKDVRIEGHTDNVPIHTPLYPSNWHLSVNRAVNAAYYMIEQHHLDPERVSVVGYAEFRPLVDNTSEAHRLLNRRVDIVIVTDAARDRTTGAAAAARPQAKVKQ